MQDGVASLPMRILRGKKERRKIALVATAHYLLRCMHAMLIRFEPWRDVA